MQFPANWGTFTEEILNEKLHFLCNGMKGFKEFPVIFVSYTTVDL